MFYEEDNIAIIEVITALGYVYEQMEDQKNALQCFETALEIQMEIQDIGTT